VAKRGVPNFRSEIIVYVVLTDDDRQETLTPQEFAEQYGWQNDPERVQLLPAAAPAANAAKR
jgi:hypothetical protein